MRILSFSARNFGSYAQLDYLAEDQGLTLIHGHTGSGKSTFQDIVCWGLYGVTAKGGTVEEVRTWGNTAPTKVEICVQVSGKIVTILRFRGTQQQNDLYLFEGIEKLRGKDATETQKLIDTLLGCDAHLFRTSAYFSEMSPTFSFFTANAKARREILENVANVSLATQLGEASSEARKQAKKAVEYSGASVKQSAAECKQVNNFLNSMYEKQSHWDKSHADILLEFEVKHKNFNAVKNSQIEAALTKLEAWNASQLISKQTALDKLERLESKLINIRHISATGTCSTCGGPDEAGRKQLEAVQKDKDYNRVTEQKMQQIKFDLQRLQTQVNPWAQALESAKSEINTFDERIAYEKEQENPYTSEVARQKTTLKAKEEELYALNRQLEQHEYELLCYTQLYDASLQLRALQLEGAVSQIQDAVNDRLSTYFESAFRVDFSIPSSDKLEVVIWKDGHECTYTQLSKGQRSLLRLCFMLSVMEAAANRAGIHFDTLFLDEPLDGLDPELKTKAFEMFAALEAHHNSVFVIDHTTEFKALFTNQYKAVYDGTSTVLEKD